MPSEINLQSIEAPTKRNIHCDKIGNIKEIQSTHLVIKMCVNIRSSLFFLLLQIKLCWNVDGLYKSTAQRYKATEDYWLLENDAE